MDITTDNSRTTNGKELYGFHKLEGAYVPDEVFFHNENLLNEYGKRTVTNFGHRPFDNNFVQ